MRQTATQSGANTTAFAQAGASTIGLSSQSQRSAKEQTEQVAPTSHWKSTYNGVVEETLANPTTQAQRPLWSLPRQAYSSKRSFFQTENMKSFGTYGHNPRSKLNAEHSAHPIEIKYLICIRKFIYIKQSI